MSEKQAPPAAWKNIVAGGLAGVAEISVMYPTDVAKTRAQLSKEKVSMVSTLRSIYGEFGMRGLYRGVVTPILAEAPKRAWKFSANEAIKGVLVKASPDGKLGTFGATVSGALAGASEALVNCPFETVKVRMQAKENLSRFKTSTECLTAMVREEGVMAAYNGLEPQMLRNMVWNGLYFGTVGFMATNFPVKEDVSYQERLTHKFFTGVVGSMLGTLANTPFDVVKSRMQQQMGPDPETGLLKYRNSFQSIGLIAQEEGPAALYKGLGPRLVRLGPGGGIMIVAFEVVSGWLKDF